MEGDGPTGSTVIPEYLNLLDHLQKRFDSMVLGDALLPMINTMRIRVQRYLDEALGCETLVMATLLNPHFRIELFDMIFGRSTRRSDANRAQDARKMFQQHFEKRKEDLKQVNKDSTSSTDIAHLAAPPASTRGGIFGLYKSKAVTVSADEVASYFEGQDAMAEDIDARDCKSVLGWWKVRVLFLMHPYP